MRYLDVLNDEERAVRARIIELEEKEKRLLSRIRCLELDIKIIENKVEYARQYSWGVDEILNKKISQHTWEERFRSDSHINSPRYSDNMK